jgi:hypothetical protein
MNADRTGSRAILEEPSGYSRIERPQWTADGSGLEGRGDPNRADRRRR